MTELARFKRFCAEILELELEPFQDDIAEETFTDRRDPDHAPRGERQEHPAGRDRALAPVSVSEPQVAVGVPMRTIQEWMGHRDKTTLIYTDYAPSEHEGLGRIAAPTGR